MNMHRVNMDKFVQGYEFLNKEELKDCKFYKSGDLFYIIRPLGKTSDTTLVWCLNLGQTIPKISLQYERFDDQSKMPTKKIWHKREIKIKDFIFDTGYNRMALESFYALTVADFLFKQIHDGFVVVVKPLPNASVVKGGLPSRGMCDRSNTSIDSRGIYHG